MAQKAEKDWIYESTRVKARDGLILSESDIERLSSIQAGVQSASRPTANSIHDVETAFVRFLTTEKGWSGAPDLELSELLDSEQRATFSFIGELTYGGADLAPLTFLSDWHNLKAAIKLVYSGASDLYFENESAKNDICKSCFLPARLIDHGALLSAIRQNAYANLPEPMREPARRAMNALAELASGQMSDMIIDHAALTLFHKAALDTGFQIFKDWADFIIDTGNIQTAVRLIGVGKSDDFLNLALVQGGRIPVDDLISALHIGDAAQIESRIQEAAQTFGYEGAVEALQSVDGGAFEFEEWKTNWVSRKLRREMNAIFGLPVIIAFAMLRLEDIRTVRRLAGR